MHQPPSTRRHPSWPMALWSLTIIICLPKVAPGLLQQTQARLVAQSSSICRGLPRYPLPSQGRTRPPSADAGTPRDRSKQPYVQESHQCCSPPRCSQPPSADAGSPRGRTRQRRAQEPNVIVCLPEVTPSLLQQAKQPSRPFSAALYAGATIIPCLPKVAASLLQQTQAALRDVLSSHVGCRTVPHRMVQQKPQTALVPPLSEIRDRCMRV